jgi:DNA-binding NarL/FixJ family response regulator
VKILLVDDHALFREGMKLLLNSLDSNLDLEEASECAEGLDLARSHDFDLVLLDLKLPGLNGLDALDALRDAAPGVPIVVLSGEDDPSIVRTAIERGAMGFIPKSSTPEVLIQALRLVLAHGVYLPPLALGAPRAALSAGAATPGNGAGDAALPGITQRQMEVLRCVIRGKPNKIIARELNISEGTVKLHLSAVLRALGVHNRTEAVYAAAKLGIRLS